jgi:hypothetical protein
MTTPKKNYRDRLRHFTPEVTALFDRFKETGDLNEIAAYLKPLDLIEQVAAIAAHLPNALKITVHIDAMLNDKHYAFNAEVRSSFEVKRMYLLFTRYKQTMLERQRQADSHPPSV